MGRVSCWQQKGNMSNQFSADAGEWSTGAVKKTLQAAARVLKRRKIVCEVLTATHIEITAPALQRRSVSPNSGYHYTYHFFSSWEQNSGPQVSPSHGRMLRVLYRVIHKSLRDFRTRLRNNQDRHGRKEHINQVFFVLGALAYFQVPPLGGSREKKWRSQ